YLDYEPRMFHYQLSANRNKNNVDIRMYNASGQLMWPWFSPDDRVGGRWYHLQPPMQVPPGGYDPSTSAFDVQFVSAPKCTFATLTCCSGSNGWPPNGYPYGDWGWSPPYMTRLSNTQVKAELEGHSTFEWRLRASGVPDRYVISGSVLTVDQWSYS